MKRSRDSRSNNNNDIGVLDEHAITTVHIVPLDDAVEMNSTSTSRDDATNASMSSNSSSNSSSSDSGIMNDLLGQSIRSINACSGLEKNDDPDDRDEELGLFNSLDVPKLSSNVFPYLNALQDNMIAMRDAKAVMNEIGTNVLVHEAVTLKQRTLKLDEMYRRTAESNSCNSVGANKKQKCMDRSERLIEQERVAVLQQAFRMKRMTKMLQMLRKVQSAFIREVQDCLADYEADAMIAAAEYIDQNEE